MIAGKHLIFVKNIVVGGKEVFCFWDVIGLVSIINLVCEGLTLF